MNLLYSGTNSLYEVFHIGDVEIFSFTKLINGLMQN